MEGLEAGFLLSKKEAFIDFSKAKCFREINRHGQCTVWWRGFVKARSHRVCRGMEIICKYVNHFSKSKNYILHRKEYIIIRFGYIFNLFAL